VDKTYHKPNRLTPDEQAEMDRLKEKIRELLPAVDALIHRIDARRAAEGGDQ
jgi:hypothetical protein